MYQEWFKEYEQTKKEGKEEKNIKKNNKQSKN